MQVSTEELFEELIELTQKAVHFGTALKKLTHLQLKYRSEPDTWNIYECLEHLNLYGDHYLEGIERALYLATPTKNDAVFKGSFLGNYFVKIIRPMDGKIKKMKTATEMNPIAAKLDMDTVDRFIEQQQKLLLLLEKSKHYDLKKIRIKTTLSKYLNLGVGDTLRFMVYHNERHLAQAREMLPKVGKKAELVIT